MDKSLARPAAAVDGGETAPHRPAYAARELVFDLGK
jgi:hypothetical protein